jgi:hypothetical protein
MRESALETDFPAFWDYSLLVAEVYGACTAEFKNIAQCQVNTGRLQLDVLVNKVLKQAGGCTHQVDYFLVA